MWRSPLWKSKCHASIARKSVSVSLATAVYKAALAAVAPIAAARIVTAVKADADRAVAAPIAGLVVTTIVANALNQLLSLRSLAMTMLMTMPATVPVPAVKTRRSQAGT
jgi:hypothetical protein